MSEPTPSIEPSMAEKLVGGIFATARSTASLPVDDALELLLLLPEAQMVEQQQDELAALRTQVAEQTAWRGRAEVVLRLLTDRKDSYHWPQHECWWDSEHKHYIHAPNCPVVQARTLLGEGGQ